MIEVIVRNSSSNGETGYKGVSKTSNTNQKYEAFVLVPQVRGHRKIYISSHDTIAEAVQARVDFIVDLL